MLPAGVAAHISTENDGPSARAYSKRLERAKTSNTLTGKKEGAGAGSGTGFSLNLSDVKQTEASAAGVEGEHKVGESAQTMMTPRAAQAVAVTVRGAPKHRQRPLFKIGPAILGPKRVRFSWRPGGDMIATASVKDGLLVLNLFRRDGTLYNTHQLGEGPCEWIEWDCKGEVLGILQAGVGIYLWDVPPRGSEEMTTPMSLCQSITNSTSFCKWSRVNQMLAIGTKGGKVILFNKAEGVMQLHEKKGKHGAPVTCGDWLFDNRLGLASGLRVKISQPVAEVGAKWESYSKFRLGGFLSKVPKHIRQAGEPNRLQFTLGYPPFVAVSVGDKYLLTFDTTRVHEDLGLTFPDDYGGICGFRWLQQNILLVGLSNGYIVTVDFGALIKLQQNHKLPDRVSAMGTTKVFNEYLQDISAIQMAGAAQRVACCGDVQVKVIHRTGVDLEVHLEVQLDRKPTIGEYLDKVEWDDQGRAFAVSATDGYLYVHELLDP